MTAHDAPPVTRGRERFLAMKAAGRQIVMVTCYDYPTATIEDEAGVDVIFVGDSVGTNMLGYETEAEVTMEDMLHHLRAVRRGVTRAYLLVDLPYHAYETPALARENAHRLLAAGADGVKIEGGSDKAPVVRALVEAGIDVCGHIGFTPQTLHRPGKKGRVQGKSFDRALALVESAEEIEEAGAMMLVLELVTAEVTAIITDRLTIPTIGIGAGGACDGQVLVVTDLLGLNPISYRLAKRYTEWRQSALDAVREYAREVRERAFPTADHAFPTDPEELARLQAALTGR